jgi:hypothetical protein
MEYLSVEAPKWEPRGRAPLLRASRDMYKKALKMEHFFLQELREGT